MQVITETITPEVPTDHSFDSLCQDFNGGSFYGLEYILEDFFQNTMEKSSSPRPTVVDWFGLN